MPPPPEGCSSWLLPQAKAQGEAFAIAPLWADMLDPSVSLSVTALPQPGGANTYSGQVPTRSQMVRTNGDGCVLFFAVDGWLYDHDGYLIADAKGDECQQCLEPGVMEMMSVPVPGYCNLYYIFSARSSSDTDWDGDPEWPTRVQVAILDLSAQNPWFLTRKGALMDLGGGEPDLTGVTLDVFDNIDAPVPSEFVAWLGYSFKGVSNTPMLRAIDPTGSGDLFWLYMIGTQAVAQYRIDATGLHLVADGMEGEHYQPTASQWGSMPDKPYYRDATVVKNASDQVMLAMTDDYLQGWASGNFSTGHGPVLIMRFNAITGTLIATEEIPHGTGGLPDFGNDNGGSPSPPGTGLTGGPGGIAWLDNGTRLLIQGEAVVDNEWEHRIGVFDLVANSWTDLTGTFNVQNSPAYIYTRLSASTMNGGAAAYYVPHSTGLGRFGDPGGNPSWTSDVATSSGTVPSLFAGFPNDGFYDPLFINAQVTKDNAHMARVLSPACCTVWSNYLAEPGYDFPQGATTFHWNADDNPFGNCDEVTFSSDLVIPTGVTLYINDMTLKFAEGVRMILRAGSKVYADHSTFTATDCLGLRWAGIRVEGVSSDLTQDWNVQGNLKLWYCTVEEAETGVWCRREDVDGYFGGIVRSYQTTFLDCIDGVRIEQYHRFANGVEQSNRSYFTSTDFTTSIGWPDNGVNNPGKHVWLYRVNGVKFNGCSFTNGATLLWTNVGQRGYGIYASRATFKCEGFQNYTENRFANLTVGALVSAPDPAWAYRFNGMAFQNNAIGVYDLYSVNAVITNNKFTTLALPTTLTNSSVGLYFYQSRGYTVERNEFWDGDNFPPEVPSVGIWFRGPATMENRIYDNDFHGCDKGNVVQGDHGDEFGGVPPSGTGLQLLCGEYWDEDYDQFIMEDGYIRINQGQGGDVTLTANNLFHQDVDCSTTFEPYVIPSHPDVVNVRYHYFAEDLAELRPECVEVIDQGPDETWIGSHFDLVPTEAQIGDAFDLLEHCAAGILDESSGHVADHLVAYHAKVMEHSSAVEAYLGQVDNGDKDAPLEAVAATPAWPSHQLRDLLLLHSPLSDTVMYAAIHRQVPMDPWHLTQVLIANSRVSEYVWRELDDTQVLPIFHYNLLLANQDQPSLRSVLEQEISMRSDEKERILRRLELALDEDSMYVGKVDTLLNAYLADSMGTGLTMAYRLAVQHDRYTQAAQIKARILGQHDVEVLVGLGDMEEAVAHDWFATTPAQRAQLWDWAFNADRQGSAEAWALLLLLGETDSLPPAELPPAYRASTSWEQGADHAADIAMAAYPNPASDRAMITLPSGLVDPVLEFLDAQARLVRSMKLTGSAGIAEIDLGEVPDGLYLLRLSAQGLPSGECKLTVVR